MNLLDNKELLHRLLRQGDMLNTLHGGVVYTSIKQCKFDNRIEIEAIAPGLHPEQFQVAVNGNKLIVFSMLIPYNTEDMESEEENVFGMPMFYREVKLSPLVDKKRIVAEYDQGRIKVIAPYHDTSEIHRKINIRNKE